MSYAVTLVVSAPQRAVFLDFFRAAHTNMFTMGFLPHISLGVFDRVDIQQLDSMVERFARKTKALDVVMSTIGMFPNEQPSVLMLPVVTAALLEMHRDLHREIGGLAQDCSEYYLPGSWSPHLTLGTADSLSSALEIISSAYKAKLAGRYLFDEISLIEWYPVRTISSYDLVNI